MSFTTCQHCENQHICHIDDHGRAGQNLYERIQKAYLSGDIGWPAIPGQTFGWETLTGEEQAYWNDLANQ